MEERLLSKQKEYQQKRKQKEIESQREKQKDCTFNPNLNKPGRVGNLHSARKSDEGDILSTDFPFDKYIDQETSNKLRDDRADLASKTK